MEILRLRAIFSISMQKSKIILKNSNGILEKVIKEAVRNKLDHNIKVKTQAESILNGIKGIVKNKVDKEVSSHGSIKKMAANIFLGLNQSGAGDVQDLIMELVQH